MVWKGNRWGSPNPNRRNYRDGVNLRLRLTNLGRAFFIFYPIAYNGLYWTTLYTTAYKTRDKYQPNER